MAAEKKANTLLAAAEDFLETETGRKLSEMLESRRAAGVKIFPPDPFAALRTLEASEVKVVILGQDPYHGEGQANGLAFSVAEGCRFPPSLRNIFKEIERSLALPMPKSGDLSRWAQQGVLLLNTVLTVEEGAPRSHADKGWETLTADLLETVAKQDEPVAFLLWGRDAQLKAPLIEKVGQGKHLILSSNHPSPLSALRPPVPFIGNDHFKKVNAWLSKQNRTPIDWS